jgi:glycine betaine/proline transport system substrate-binding protein
MKRLITALLAGAMLVGLLAGCGEGDKKTITLTYVEWASEIASTNVVKAVLQEKMGYKVELLPVSAAAMWQGIASGDGDAMVAAWLPTTHGHYLEKVQDKVENLGPNLKGTKIGLVVPKYVTIDSIPEMKENAEKFDKQIIGIDPGAGIMSTTEKAIKEYGLDQFRLVEGSGATMTMALQNAIKNNEWIAVTGWTPHWKFARWDLKYLQDPKKIYGGEEFIATIARKGLKKDMPEAYQFLDQFFWQPSDMEQLMVWNQEKGADPYKNAVKWINQNPEKVQEWLAGVETK